MHRHCGTTALALALAASLAAGSAHAQAPASRVEAMDLRIADGPLGDTLVAIAQRAQRTISIDPALVAGRTASAIEGRFTIEQAFAAALAGTGLRVTRTDGGDFILVGTPAIDLTGVKGRVLSTIRVTDGGASAAGGYGTSRPTSGDSVGVPTQSANGSSDVLATEGTGSYAPPAIAIVGGAPRSLKDTPRSVSVITRQQIDDQRINSLGEALNNTPGIYTQQNGNDNYTVVSRGFAIENYQVDGALSVNTQVKRGSSSAFQVNPDLAMFDSVTVLRGGDALLSASGAPGGVVNLQRKRPLDAPQFLVELSGSNFGSRRAMVDGSMPIALDGALKLRAVATYNRDEFYYDLAYNTDYLGYLNLEYTLDPATSFNVGGNYQRNRSLPGTAGVPLYSDGTRITELQFGRCLCFSDNINRRETWEVFTQFKHKFSDKWAIDGSFNYGHQSDYFRATYITALSYGIVKGTDRGATLTGNQNGFSTRQWSAAFNVNGGFRLFGRDQSFTLASTYNKSVGFDSGIAASFLFDIQDDGTGAGARWVDYRNIDRRQAPPPSSIITTGDPNSPSGGTVDSGSVAAQLRLSPLPRVRISASGRFSYAKYDFAGDYGFKSTETYFTKPSFDAAYDITKRLAIYGALSFLDSTNNSLIFSKDGVRLPPVKGSNLEGGLKFATSGGRLNVSLKVFRTQQRNIPTQDFTVQLPFDFYGPRTSCCFINQDSLTLTGGEFEMNGALTPRLQILASYTLTNTQTGDQADGSKRNFVIQTPRHLGRLLLTYSPPGRSLSGLRIGAGFKAQSAVTTPTLFYSDIQTINDTGTGLPQIIGIGERDGEIRQQAYLIPAMFATYTIRDRYTIQLNIDNPLNRRYFETLNTLSSNNFYGAPRTVMLTLRGKF